jgi:hypothetical protein
MNVNFVTGVGRTVLSAAPSDPPTNAPPARTIEVAPRVLVDQVTREPVPPRFPWRSWLTARIESTSSQPVPYPSAPPLGENVDQSA